MFQRIICSLSLLSLSIATAQAAETHTLDTPRLRSMENFRDVAGTSTANTTSHDGTMRAGVFYRANAVTPSAEDLTTLNTLGIKANYDLRTGIEVAAKPDAPIAGASNIHNDMIGDESYRHESLLVESATSGAEVAAMMESSNRGFVSDAGMRTQFGKLLTAMANGDDAAMFHCTHGKDRTGCLAASTAVQ